MLSYRWAVIQAQGWPKSIVKKQAWAGTYPIVINWTNRKVPFNRSNYTSTVTVTSRTIDLERKEFSVFHDWNLNKTGAFIAWLIHVAMTHACARDTAECIKRVCKQWDSTKWFCNQWEQYKMDRSVKSLHDADYYYHGTVPLRWYSYIPARESLRRWAGGNNRRSERSTTHHRSLLRKHVR